MDAHSPWDRQQAEWLRARTEAQRDRAVQSLGSFGDSPLSEATIEPVDDAPMPEYDCADVPPIYP